MKPELPVGTILRFNEGDEKAFEQIYAACYTSVFAYCLKRLGNREEAEDVTAIAFAQLWKKRGGFHSIENIMAFLYTCARNGSMDLIKHRAVVRRFLVTLAGIETETEVPTDTRMNWQALARLEAVFREIKKLPRQCRLIFLFSFTEGLSNPDIARLLHINEKTVRNQKARALKKLRSMFNSPKA